MPATQSRPRRSRLNEADRAPPESVRRLDGPLRLPPSGFTYSLTLSSKCFSTFPHGTCSLSVSSQYLALDGVYHPLWAAFPNNPTPGTRRASASTATKGLTPAMGRGLDQKNVGSRSRTHDEFRTLHFLELHKHSDLALGYSRFTRRYCGNPC